MCVGVIYPRYCGLLVIAQNSETRSAPSSGIRLGNIHLVLINNSTSTSWRGEPTNLKRTNRGDIACRDSCALQLSMGRWDFPHQSALPSDPGRGSEPLHARGLLILDKHRLFQASGGIGLKHWPWWDVSVGTHTYLTLCTQVWNPSSSPLDIAMPREHA
jgi:hypothetical protein